MSMFIISMNKTYKYKRNHTHAQIKVLTNYYLECCSLLMSIRNTAVLCFRRGWTLRRRSGSRCKVGAVKRTVLESSSADITSPHRQPCWKAAAVKNRSNALVGICQHKILRLKNKEKAIFKILKKTSIWLYLNISCNRIWAIYMHHRNCLLELDDERDGHCVLSYMQSVGWEEGLWIAGGFALYAVGAPVLMILCCLSIAEVPCSLTFNVKFYPPDPTQLTEDITR